MSVLYGEWNLDGKPVDPVLVSSADAMLAPYAPDALSHFKSDGVVLAYHALHTTTESRRENQPFESASGAILTWDGRLDNREDLIRDLTCGLTPRSTDVEIVSAAFDRWGVKCLSKLLGDWALAMWNGQSRELLLARDFAGVRPLYYASSEAGIRWSSVLDPLIVLSGKQLHLNEEHVAGWLAMHPAADTSPYMGIQAVPPSSYVAFDCGGKRIQRYWDFDPNKCLRYASDHEYEERFREVFGRAVARRLRSDRPICAELSGGMDSTSIVCMADFLTHTSNIEPRIDTVSFFDPSEPNANEAPYFKSVEEKRGRYGFHINLATNKIFSFEDTDRLEASPSVTATRPNDSARAYRDFLELHGYRVVLSGIGGDEFMGGVPTHVPEVQDLLQAFQVRKLAQKLKLWALSKRKPWIHLLGEAVAGFLPQSLASEPKYRKPAVWLDSNFVKCNRRALSGFDTRTSFWGPRASLQANLSTIDALRRQIGASGLPQRPAREIRYPYLDRNLLEFIFALPREQLIQPGRRRALMRKSLTSIVPNEVLERRRKAFMNRAPRTAINAEWANLLVLCQDMASAQCGFVDEAVFKKALLDCRNSENIALVSIMRTVILEVWLRGLFQRKVVMKPDLEPARKAMRIRATSAAS